MSSSKAKFKAPLCASKFERNLAASPFPVMLQRTALFIVDAPLCFCTKLFKSVRTWLQLETILVICSCNVSGIAWPFVLAVSSFSRVTIVSRDVSSRDMASKSWRAARQFRTKEVITKDVLPIVEIRATHPVVIDRGSISFSLMARSKTRHEAVSRAEEPLLRAEYCQAGGLPLATEDGNDCPFHCETSRLIRATSANVSGSAPRDDPLRLAGVPAIIGRNFPGGRGANVSGGYPP